MLEELDKHNITLEIRSLGLRSDDIDHRARIYSIFHQKRAKETNIPLRNSGTFPKRRRGPVPYGYMRIDSKRDIVIPDFPVVPARSPFLDSGDNAERVTSSPAEVVITIFDWYIASESLKHVSERLYELGIPPPRLNGFAWKKLKKWSPSSIRRILQNPIYGGFRELPSLVSQETFSLANSMKRRENTLRQ
jgi:hypothetical protein